MTISPCVCHLCGARGREGGWRTCWVWPVGWVLQRACVHLAHLGCPPPSLLPFIPPAWSSPSFSVAYPVVVVVAVGQPRASLVASSVCGLVAFAVVLFGADSLTSVAQLRPPRARSRVRLELVRQPVRLLDSLDIVLHPRGRVGWTVCGCDDAPRSIRWHVQGSVEA